MAANSVLEQIRKLDEQKAKLMEDAKKQALDKAKSAVEELNELGFSYRLVEGSGSAPRSTSRSQSTTGRRSGIREDVLSAITKAGPDGVSSSGIRSALGIADGDKSGAQSVANALSALKKSGKIADKNGSYVSA